MRKIVPCQKMKLEKIEIGTAEITHMCINVKKKRERKLNSRERKLTCLKKKLGWREEKRREWMGRSVRFETNIRTLIWRREARFFQSLVFTLAPHLYNIYVSHPITLFRIWTSQFSLFTFPAFLYKILLKKHFFHSLRDININCDYYKNN